MRPGQYNFPAHPRGDTFKLPSPFKLIYYGSDLNLTGCTIDVWIRKNSAKGHVMLKWSSNNGDFTFTSPTEGEFAFVPQVVNIPAGRYFYDLQITNSSGEVNTYLNGYWDIIDDSTK